MENRRQVIPLFVIAAIVILTLILLKTPEAEHETPLIPVRTLTLSSEPPVKLLQISGTTQSAESAILRFQVGGRVTKKYVRLGDAINKGDSLAKLYNPELEPITVSATENVARLTAQTEQARRDFERIDRLFKEQAVTLAEWESVKTRLVASQNAQSSAQSELERATQVANELHLVAPFSGSVTEILIDNGEVVAAGAPAIRLSNPSAVELKLAVSDSILQQITLGQTIAVYKALQPDSAPLQGTISEISPYRERGALPEIIINLDADRIGPGVAVNAQIQTQAKSGLSVPMRSVIMTGENTVAVYRVVDGEATLVPIRPIQISTNSVTIEQGLNAGDALVVEGISQLFNGAKVIESSKQNTAAAPEQQAEPQQ